MFLILNLRKEKNYQTPHISTSVITGTYDDLKRSILSSLYVFGKMMILKEAHSTVINF